MKKTVSFLIIFALLFSLSACSAFPKPEDIIGLWEASYTYNGNDFSILLEIRNDETFTYLIWKNDEFSECITGDYGIEGKEINLYDDTALVHHGKAIVLGYSDGCLTGGDGKYTFTLQEGKKMSIDKNLAVLIAANYSGINKMIEKQNMFESFSIFNKEGEENKWDSFQVKKSTGVYRQNTWEVTLESGISGFDYYGDFIYNRKLEITVYVSLTGEVDEGLVYISSYSR